MLWKRLSIGRKLFFTIVATVVVTIAFFASTVFWNTRNGISQYILTAEIARFETVAEAFAKAHDPRNPGWPEMAENRRNFDRLVRENFFTSAMPGPEGRASSESRPQSDERPRQGSSRSPDEGSENFTRPRDLLNLRGRLALLDADGEFVAGGQLNTARKAREPIVTYDKEGEQVILGYVELAMPLLDQRAADLLFETHQIRTLSVTALLAIILSSLAAYALSRLFVAPIRDLLYGAKKLSDGRLATRLDVNRFDEMGELQQQFNKLAHTLEVNEAAERQWISDTSHELQTPLAILRAEIEAIQDGVRRADKKTLSTLHHSVIRLSTLVKDISTLSHAREEANEEQYCNESLSEIIQTSAENAESLAAEAGLSLELEIEPELIVYCNRIRIGQLIDNLLSNSIRYTDAGGKIRLTLFRKRKRVFIHCDDTAPCPSDNSISKLFRRFYRGDQSRSRKSGGSGLGLAICESIVSLHRGHIYAEPSPIGGLRIRVALPIQRYE